MLSHRISIGSARIGQAVKRLSLNFSANNTVLSSD
jgi:hypothetical protein